MKLTAKLAYNQVKINKSRTICTIIGIVLSTALITSVCSFVASGNALVVHFLGEGYGDYGGTLNSLILIPAIIFSAIIVSMSVVVISNSFRVSAEERTMQFGILKSVGSTKRQITSIVMHESILLSTVGIPIGIILGLILTFLGVQVANYLLEELNSLVHIMLNELTLVIDFVIAWQALIVSALISFLSVLFSAWIPANKAAKIAAIDSIRGVGEVKIESKQIHVNPLIEKLFGFEGKLAAKNMKRNKRNLRASVISLTVGIILFINLNALTQQAKVVEDFMNPDVDYTVIVDYTSARSFVINETTGRNESIIAVPIDSEVGEQVTERLREYANTTIFGFGEDGETYNAIIPRELISSQMMEVFFYAEEQQEYEVNAVIMTIDMENYIELCKRAGVPVGSNILLNHYIYNDNGRLVTIEPFLFEEQNLRLIKADNSIHEIPIHGVLTQENIPDVLVPLNNTHIARLIVPQGDMRFYTWYADPVDIDGFIEYANVVMAEMFPRDEELNYMELGFTTRVYEIQDYMKIMNIAIVLGMVFAYSFVVMLALIGLTSVISTISTNMRMRYKEFAVLQSIGMTDSGLKRMLSLESIMYSVKSLVIGLPIAIVLTYLVNIPIRTTFPVPYQIPWVEILWCIVTVFIITWIIARYSISQLRNRNIVETIRSGSGI